MFVDDDGQHVLSTHLMVKHAQCEVAKYVPGGASIVDDFLANGREEAACESLE